MAEKSRHLRPVSFSEDTPIDEKFVAYVNTLHRLLRELDVAGSRADWKTAALRAIDVSTLASTVGARCAHVLLHGVPEPHKAGRCMRCFNARPIGVTSELCDDCELK